MRSWGIFLIVMAVGSVLLPKIGMQFIVVAWIDWFGPTTGWLIRATLLAIGIALVALSRRRA